MFFFCLQAKLQQAGVVAKLRGKFWTYEDQFGV